MEVFKPIADAPDYFVSNEGRVKSLKGATERILKQGNQRGYKFVVLMVDGKRLCRKVHQLVLAAFQGPRPDGFVCIHADSDRSNNCLSNLRYGTQSENILQSIYVDKTHHWVRPTIIVSEAEVEVCQAS